MEIDTNDLINIIGIVVFGLIVAGCSLAEINPLWLFYLLLILSILGIGGIVIGMLINFLCTFFSTKKKLKLAMEGE